MFSAESIFPEAMITRRELHFHPTYCLFPISLFSADKAHRDLDNHMISEYFSGLDQEMEDV